MECHPARHITVDCPGCQLRVSATVVANREGGFDEHGTPDYRVSIATCPECTNPIVTRECGNYDYQRNDLDWILPVRLWPEPERTVDRAVPAIVQVSLDEAVRCHRAGAHIACAVMCGRALEGVCVHYEIKDKLGKGLQELHTKNLIDKRLLEWGEELRRVRNAAAHASEEQIDKEDATDLLHFVRAICDYIFVLTARFEAFKTRRAAATQTGTPTIEIGLSPNDPKVAE